MTHDHATPDKSDTKEAQEQQASVNELELCSRAAGFIEEPVDVEENGAEFPEQTANTVVCNEGAEAYRVEECTRQPMEHEADVYKVENRVQCVPDEIADRMGLATRLMYVLHSQTHPQANARTVPALSSHPNARSFSRAGRLSAHAARTITTTECIRETTCIDLHRIQLQI